jgi:hypothetical protein
VANSVVTKVPLSDDEWTTTIIEANRRGVLPDHFVADAIREKLAHKPAVLTSDPVQPVPEVGLEDAHDRLELLVPQAVVMLSLLSDEYWKACDTTNEYERARANGLISLAHGVSSQLERALAQGVDEQLKTHLASQSNPQRRAA